MRIGVGKLLRMGLVSERVWREGKLWASRPQKG